MTETRRIMVGGEEYRIEPFSGRKALRVLHTVKHITTGVPAILDEWAAFRSQYESKHGITIDRASARRQFPPMPLYDEEPLVNDGKVVTNEDGDPLVRRVARTREDGSAVMGPDPLGHMTDADWEASGNVLRLPRSPSIEEQIAAVFPTAMQLAEEQVVRLLALVAMSNADVKKNRNDLTKVLEERGDDLLDSDLGELIELAVVAGECVTEQYREKAKELGGRLGNAAKLFGLNLPNSTEPETEKDSTSKETSSNPSVTSSTDSPSPTTGTNEPPLTEPVGVGSVPSSAD